MKAGTAASIIAYTYLFQYRSHLKGSLGLCAVSDEETGGKFGARFLLEQGKSEGVIAGSMLSPVVWGLSGLAKKGV